MKAISLWQPWATLWLLTDPDEKVFETRHWYASYRGPLLVYATLKRDGDVRAALADPFFQERLAAHGLTPADLAYGALIGSVDLVGCCRMDRMPEPTDRERSFGLWKPERYAFERGPETRIFSQPIPWRGKQAKFLEVPEAAIPGAERVRTLAHFFSENSDFTGVFGSANGNRTRI